MSGIVIKVLGAERTINSTANTISSAKCVRILNTGANAQINVSSTVSPESNGSLTMLTNTEVVIVKYASDTLTANTNSGVLATPIAFGN